MTKPRRKKGTGQIFHGYLLITVNGKQVRAHRVIMEQHLGRPLRPFPFEIVHHINGDTLDNRICNLKVITQSEHSAEIFKKSIIVNGKKLCTKCNEFLPLTSFHKQRVVKCGLKSICKSCHKIHYPH